MMKKMSSDQYSTVSKVSRLLDIQSGPEAVDSMIPFDSNTSPFISNTMHYGVSTLNVSWVPCHVIRKICQSNW